MENRVTVSICGEEYTFVAEGGRGLPHEARRLSKGVFSWLKRIPPLEPPETTRGHPSTPHCLSLQGITARAAQRTACGFLLPLSIWSASMSAQPLLRRGYGHRYGIFRSIKS